MTVKELIAEVKVAADIFEDEYGTQRLDISDLIHIECNSVRGKHNTLLVSIYADETPFLTEDDINLL